MTPDKDIQQLFDSAKAEFEDNEDFLQTLSRSLDKVEYIKQVQDRQIKWYRHTVIYALVAGVCAGSLAMATIGNIPSDFLQLLSEKVNLLQIPFLEPRTVLNMAVSLFIGTSAFWIARNVQEIRASYVKYNYLHGMNMKNLLLLVIAGLSLFSCAPKETAWSNQFESMLPLLGHRNWIVVADMAYPLQSGDGITTIYADEDYLDVLAKVKGSIDAAPHVYPHIWRDRELGFIDESLMPGIDATKAGIERILGSEAQSIDHEDLIKRLDEAGGLYQVVIIKTPMTTPYTTVFFELDCDYWNAEKAAVLDRKMGR